METYDEEIFIEPRLAHTCTEYDEYLLFYGGLKKFRGGFKVADVYQGFFMYHTVTGKWAKPAKANNNMLPLRRNHTSFVLADLFIAYGGYDESGKLQDGLVALSLEDFEWKGMVETTDQRVKLPVIFHRRKRNIKENKNSLKYRIEHLKESSLVLDGSPGPITFHAACLVVHTISIAGSKRFSLYDRDQNRLPHPKSNILDLINSKRVKLSKIETLEKRLQEGMQKNLMSDYQQKNLQDQIKTEIINEKCRMVENTETLSELSRTIDEMDQQNIGMGSYNHGLPPRMLTGQTDKSLHDFEESNIDDEKITISADEDKKLILDSSQL